MAITLEQLTGHYPLVYHMAELDALPQLLRHGLLSTTAILDLCEIEGQDRYPLEAQIRRDAYTLRHPVHGTFVLRDQKPLSESKLAGCLQDSLTVEEWLRLLNSKTFFWLGRDRVEVLLAGRAYRNREHIVIEIRTETLVDACADGVTLARMNTGSTSPYAHERGLSTMLPLSSYPYEDRRRRGLRPAAELSVDYSVPNLAALIANVYVGSADAGLTNRNDLLT